MHLVLVDLRDSELDGQQAEDRLHDIGITVNRNAVPFDPRPPAVSSGLRVGSPALATRGLQEDDFGEVGAIMATALTARLAGLAQGRAVRARARDRRPLPAVPAHLVHRRRHPGLSGLFDLHSVSASRGGRRVLDDVSVRSPTARPRLLGPSGSGKSSLLRLLNRLSDPDLGTIRFEGDDVRDARRARPAPAGGAGSRSCRRRCRARLPTTCATGRRCATARPTSTRASGAPGSTRTFADRDAARAVGRRAAARDARARRSRSSPRCSCSTSPPRRSTRRRATESSGRWPSSRRRESRWCW